MRKNLDISEEAVEALTIQAIKEKTVFKLKAEQILENASKWKHYRDVHYRLYEVTKDIEGYEKSMKTHQTIIKNWMETYNEKLIEAVTNICKQEDDARYQLKFLCAGYELASGVDYTCR